MIKITLEVRSGLKKLLNADVLDVMLQEGSSFLDLADRLSESGGKDMKDLLFSEKYGFLWLCVKNKVRVLPTERLAEGDRVMLLPPLAGG